MLLDDMIALLRETARNAKVVDDEKIDDRIWQDYIMIKRNNFIKNHFNDKHNIELNTIQTEVLTMSKFDSSMLHAGISIDESVKRSGLIPKVIEFRAGLAIYEISSPDYMSKTIQYVPFDRLRWVGNGKINKHFVYGSIYDGRLYIKSGSKAAEAVRTVLLKGVFADPTLVSTYVRESHDYPLNDYMFEYIKNSILESDFRVLISTLSDNKNDASGEIQTQG